MIDSRALVLNHADRQQKGDVRRLLVISYHYPPDGSVGGLRWAGYSKYLAHLGWEVHVVTAAAQAQAASTQGVVVHSCSRRRTLNDAYNSAVQRRRSSAASGTPPRQAGPRNSEWLPWHVLTRLLRDEIATALVFPDYARGWILRGARLARRLLARHHFDAVVTSGPPHSAHLAGVLATLGRPGLLRVDMRDPWASVMGKNWGMDLYKSSLQRLAIRWLEKLVLRRAVQVISNTAEFADTLRAVHPDLAIAYLPNGIDAERLPRPQKEIEPGLTITYVGTLYVGRDVFPILQAMRELFERQPAARTSVRLRVAGHMEGSHEARFREQLAATGVADAVEVLGVLPHAQALELVSRAHLALVLAQNQPVQIPAKLYECMALEVPTLVIAEEASASAREARRIGAMTCEAHDVSGIRTIMENLWNREQSCRMSPAVPIDYKALAHDMDRNLREPPSASSHAMAAAPITQWEAMR